jgi:uncharacterized protein with von Willebrand factor type A (vWA) domain
MLNERKPSATAKAPTPPPPGPLPPKPVPPGTTPPGTAPKGAASPGIAPQGTASPARVPSLDRALCVRLTGFVSLLRENGFAVGVDDATLLVEAASQIGVLDPLVLRWSAQALLCRRAADQQRFAELFDSWFMPPNRRKLVESRGAGIGALERGNIARTGGEDNSEGTPVDAPDEKGAATSDQGKTTQRGASSDEALTQADFRHLHQPHEMRALDALMRGFAIRLRKLTLRREMAGGSRRIDIPGTARRSVSHGGEPFELVFRQRRQTPPRLVLLLDVSRSMNLYSFFFLRLARALQGVRLDTRVFIWHTRLSGVTEALRDPDPWRAQERLQLLSAGWAGGTRIGECLEQFEREHSALVHSRTALIIVSDGYDTGEPTLLANVVRRLRHRARRVVWLNPLAASDDYAPLARGMQAVLPELDLFAPANNLASIERVLPQLVLALR